MCSIENGEKSVNNQHFTLEFVQNTTNPLFLKSDDKAHKPSDPWPTAPPMFAVNELSTNKSKQCCLASVGAQRW
jgi:hypothetical protein